VKFLIDRSLGPQVLGWMRANLSADEHGDGEFGDEYKTTSLYFETTKFDVYHRHESYGRSKFRIRRYGLLDFIFLERKFRTDRLLAKRRTTVPVADLQRLADDKPDPTWKGYWFHRRILIRGLHPKIQMSYHRVARVTQTPHGLQALFALRLEKGHVIIGMDTEMDTTPRRLGMDWAVNLDKSDFLGKAALVRTAGLPDHRRLVGLTMPGPAPTEGSPIWSERDVIGHVTSSFDSPTLGKAVMLGWQKRTPFPEQVEVDGRTAAVTAPPFYDPEGTRARA
jgi:hypothetical protein